MEEERATETEKANEKHRGEEKKAGGSFDEGQERNACGVSIEGEKTKSVFLSSVLILDTFLSRFFLSLIRRNTESQHPRKKLKSSSTFRSPCFVFCFFLQIFISVFILLHLAISFSPARIISHSDPVIVAKETLQSPLVTHKETYFSIRR